MGYCIDNGLMKMVTILIKKYFYMGSCVLRGLAVSETILPLEKTSVWFSILISLGEPSFRKLVIQKVSVTVYYQKRLSDLDTLIKITITKMISFQLSEIFI
jgi:hypothetical protein